VNGLTDADFAMSGVALTDAETQTLVQRKITALHVPVALGSLVLAYNLWIDDGSGNKVQVRNLQLSPATVAKIIEGRIGNWNDPAIKQDNLGNYPNGFGSKLIIPVGRADNSAATWWLSSWLIATAKDAWEAGGQSFKGGPTTIFPAGNGVDLRTGPDNVAADIRIYQAQEAPDAGLIGFVYLSDAQKLGLPVAALQNAAGNYVLPTTQSLDAAVAAGTISPDGIFQPNFTTTDPKAYPVPVVTYAIVPKAGSPGLDPPHELVLSRFLHYAVTDGQKAAELRGYAPLPAALSTKSNAAVAQVYAPPPPTPAPTVAPRTNAPPVVAQSSGGTTPQATAPPEVAAVVQAPAAAITPAITASPVASAGSAAPVAKVVAGAIKLLGGGSAPMTVSDFLWLGAIAAIAGRALTILAERRRRSGSAPELTSVQSLRAAP